MLDWSNWSPEVVVGVTLVLLLLVIIAVVTAMCIQAGLFHTIHINTMQPEFGELVVMYKSGRGAYSESGALFTEAHTLLPQYNCIGVYYDDPEKKSSENLRYIVGLVVSEGGAAADGEDVTLLESHGYQKVVFPAVKHAVVTDFPYKNTLSCIFAVFRVYPALREYVERRELCAHPILELYDNSNKRILFVGPLEQQDSFYVPDVLEENVMSSLGEESGEDDDEDSEGDDAPADQEEEEEEGEEEDGVEEDGEAGNARAASVEEKSWEKSASLLAEGSPTPEETGNVPQGSAEESDTNTGSSFEEIDPSETTTFTSDQTLAQAPSQTPITTTTTAAAAATTTVTTAVTTTATAVTTTATTTTATAVDVQQAADQQRPSAADVPPAAAQQEKPAEQCDASTQEASV